jgi:tellurite resistance protein TerC
MMLAAESSVTDFVDIDTPTWSWAILIVSVVALLALDLWRHREAHAPTFREAALESTFWVVCAMGFAAYVFADFGARAAGEYLGVYLTEKSLSVDNVFVWALIFSSMGIPVRFQHRVLFWGIFGALTLRAGFILIGAQLVERFEGLLVVFGLFLIYTGLKIVRHRSEEGQETSTAGLGLLRRFMPVSEELDGQRFITRINGARAATPLLAALVVVEATDVVFAVDSVPASFGVANDPYLLISANAFAIMGLRAMYFLLADARDRFHYLSHALGAILFFVGVKLVLTPWYHIPIAWSLAVITGILVVAVGASILRSDDDDAAADDDTADGTADGTVERGTDGADDAEHPSDRRSGR